MPASLDEVGRQRVLDMYRIVDTLPEVACNDIVQLASILCDAPIAVTSLIDRDRQWFKASRGLDSSGSHRDNAFCARAIEAPNVLMEVPDAHADERFVANPFVTGTAGIRFYAGMPLVTEGGQAIGTVCVLDDEPRQLDARQREGLQALARLTMTLLDTRLREQELERAAVLAELRAGVRATQFAVMILQVQGLAESAVRLGERSLERQLQELERQLADVVDVASGDNVNRTSQSAEYIVVLHGDAIAATEARLRDRVEQFGVGTGITFACASAMSLDPKERIEQGFLRADEALTDVKDALVVHVLDA